MPVDTMTPSSTPVGLGDGRSDPALEGEASNGSGQLALTSDVTPGAPVSLRFVVHGIPAPQGSKSAFRNPRTGKIQQVESSKKVKPWRQDVIAAALEVTEALPQFVNPLTTTVHRGVKHEPDLTRGAFEFADGRIEPIDRRCTLLPFDCPVHVRMIFSFPRPKSHYRSGRNAHLLKADAPSQPSGKPDLDKLARSTCDALVTAALLRDDSRIVEFDRLAKVWCSEDPEALDTTGAVIEVIAR